MSAKERRTRPAQKRVIHPIVTLPKKLGIPPPGDALLETAPPFFTAPTRGVRRYLAAFGSSDPAELERLLADHVVLEMTGTTSWYSGKATCVPFIAAQATGRPGDWRMLPSMLPVGWRPAPTTKKTTRPVTRSRSSYWLRSRWPPDRLPGGTARNATAVRTDVTRTDTRV
jgi:hypothetical protein